MRTTLNKNVPPIISEDEQRIMQELMNLLSNSVKFTTEGVIELSAKLIGN